MTNKSNGHRPESIFRNHWAAVGTKNGTATAIIEERQDDAIEMAAIWETNGFTVRVMPISEFIRLS